ncbi:uncharacterized protein SPSK_08111 [Sporothrix schenckii 1099-18]|uniref:Uncharacterized protein n=1 Tax=Sporothrix schenckii 1099-18 TaxID=1397361 RepID=A0A0F2MFK1_SPOSC|nr:uncharacterized protein SPSK_08111 [Sporothrix schenckii 1099-18]KJR88458.1 hypothetical protein SPSK_08111 [Sporothrix schenckii 1099-18]
MPSSNPRGNYRATTPHLVSSFLGSDMPQVRLWQPRETIARRANCKRRKTAADFVLLTEEDLSGARALRNSVPVRACIAAASVAENAASSLPANQT